MPLDGAMVATPPAGTTAVPNTVVASAPYNALKDDIYNIFNTKVQPVTGGGSGASTAIGAYDAFNTKGADIATAATVNLDTATGAFNDLTGSVTVTAVTLSAGKSRQTRAAADFQITVGASLIGNNGGSNALVKAGDLIFWEGYSAGVVRFWVVPASQPVLYSAQSPSAAQQLQARTNLGIALGFPLLHVVDEKTSGSSAANSVSATYSQMVLNTIRTNEIGAVVTPGTNRITLLAGTYEAYCRAPGYRTGNHKLRLRNITDGVTVPNMIGANAYANNASTGDVLTDAVLFGRFTLAGTKDIELQHYAAITQTNGFGQAVSSGDVEIYAEVQIRRLS